MESRWTRNHPKSTNLTMEASAMQYHSLSRLKGLELLPMKGKAVWPTWALSHLLHHGWNVIAMLYRWQEVWTRHQCMTTIRSLLKAIKEWNQIILELNNNHYQELKLDFYKRIICNPIWDIFCAWNSTRN